LTKRSLRSASPGITAIGCTAAAHGRIFERHSIPQPTASRFQVTSAAMGDDTIANNESP